MKLYTCYTESHKSLLEEAFLPSLIEGEYELIVEKFDQNCPSGEYDSAGWDLTMKKKAELIHQAIKDNWGEVFLYVDCDVQFFKPTKEYILESIEGFDIACQDDVLSYCAGFLACRANERSLKLFEQVIEQTPKYGDDQRALNGILDEQNPDIKITKFDKRIFTIAMLGTRVWRGKRLNGPDNLLAHHANWTIGIRNKFKLMEMVRGWQKA